MIFDKVFGKNSEYFLAINVFGKSCNLAIFSIEDGRVNLTNQTFYRFAENENLTEITKRFLEKVEIGKSSLRVVFGLPSFWIEGEKVKPEFENLLLAVTNELKLSPLAFVSNSAALGFYKFRQDKNLTNFYVLQIFAQKLLVENFENGEIVRSALIDFESLDSVDFSKIFGQESPNTVFIFTEENFDQLVNSILQFFDFQKITPPKILQAKSEDFALSLATATAYDLGKLQDQTSQEVKVEQETTEEFGFVKDKDVGVANQTAPKKIPGKSRVQIFNNIFNFLKSFSLNLPKFGGKRIIFVSLAGFAILALLFSVFWFLPAAKIEILVKSTDFGKNFEVKAAPTASTVDSKNLVIPAQVVKTSKEGTKKAVTTGKKRVGEKAQGVITIFNKTTAAKTFSPGVAIIGSSNLKFVLTESVVVASRSATLEGITYGKNTAKVQSLDIGESGNLPAGTNFTFADFDSSLYSAHSNEAFTGGTAKEVNVVAEEDAQRLEQELTNELKNAAKTELIQLAKGAQIDEEAIITKPEKLQFDKQVGAEANILAFTAKLNFEATLFFLTDVEKAIGEKLKSEMPTGFNTWQNTKIEVKVEKIENDGTLRLKVSFAADLIPDINQEEIVKQVAGKSVEAAKNYLLNISDVENVNIKITPALPGFLGNMPRAKTKIKIEVKAQKNSLF